MPYDDSGVCFWSERMVWKILHIGSFVAITLLHFSAVLHKILLFVDGWSAVYLACHYLLWTLECWFSFSCSHGVSRVLGYAAHKWRWDVSAAVTLVCFAALCWCLLSVNYFCSCAVCCLLFANRWKSSVSQISALGLQQDSITRTLILCTGWWIQMWSLMEMFVR